MIRRLLWFAVLMISWYFGVVEGIQLFIDYGLRGPSLLGAVLGLIVISYSLVYVLSGYWKEEVKRGKGFWGLR